MYFFLLHSSLYHTSLLFLSLSLSLSLSLRHPPFPGVVDHLEELEESWGSVIISYFASVSLGRTFRGHQGLGVECFEQWREREMKEEEREDFILNIGIAF